MLKWAYLSIAVIVAALLSPAALAVYVFLKLSENRNAFAKTVGREAEEG